MDFEGARAQLIKRLSTEIRDDRVLTAMSGLPRECFVPAEFQSKAYIDEPLPIGFDQTISQPFIVALMTQALCITGNEKVLEIGTGSGYQAAILSRLAERVVTVERIPQMVESARKTLESLGCTNVEVCLAGRTLGWQCQAPYDAILVTAAAPAVPVDLVAQLKLGGRMVIPVGSRYLQQLYRITRHEKGNEVDQLGGCHFVPLIGEGAWNE